MQRNLEQRIMASVAAIYLWRRLAGWRAFRVYTLVVSVVTLWQLVWVHKILDNFFAVEKKGMGAVLNYIAESFIHTQVAVQLTLFAAVVTCISLVVDAVRAQTARPFA